MADKVAMKRKMRRRLRRGMGDEEESWFKLRVWTGTGWTERNELVGIRKGSGCGLRDALGNWRNPR